MSLAPTAAQAAPAFETRALDFAVGGATILAQIDLTVTPGESVALIGANGAGKTTLLRCLLGTVAATGGSVSVFGRPLRDWGRRELARRVSYVPQQAPEAAGFSVREFVAMGRYPHLRPLMPASSDDARFVEEALRTTDTEQFAERAIDSLSGGEHQRVLLAAALAQEADVLLVDEPTAHLDYRHQSDVLAVLRRLSRERGLALITVTHDIGQALVLADRIVALRAGRVEYDGPSEQLLTGDTLERIFGMPFDVVRHPRSDRPVVLPREEAP